jgi:hypothetical protein
MSGFWASPWVSGASLVIRLLVGAYFVFLGQRTLSGDAHTLADYRRWGYPDLFRLAVGVAQLMGGVGLLFPRTSPWAGALLAVILLGAVGTHALHDPPATLISPLVFLLLVGAALLSSCAV